MLQILHNSKIDTHKWNNAINVALQPKIYALSWYLQSVSPHWKAAIWGDYEYVMPLPIKYKFALPYIVQPILTQQLGIFSATEVPPHIHEKFRKILFSYFSCRYSSHSHICKLHYSMKLNLVLPLSDDYTQIYAGFNSNAKRNIKKSEKFGIVVKKIDTHIFEQHFYDFAPFTISNTEISVIQQLIHQAELHNSLEIYGAYAGEELCSITAFFIHARRAYYLLAASSEVGKQQAAAFAIIQTFIKNNCQHLDCIDFEGSEIKGIAQFYTSFGAIDQPYYYYAKHALSFLHKIL